ncbi:MAG: DUF1761 domain-containing protein [Bacteroidota bacterium]
MAQPNWLIIPLSAFIPIILGFIWYHPKVLGTKLAQTTGYSIEERTSNRTIGRLLLIYLFGILLSYVMTLISVHQVGVFQLFFMDPQFAEGTSEFNQVVNEFMDKYGDRHRTFGHGLLHGLEFSLCLGLSFFGTTAFMQGRPLKGIWIHLGFWLLSCGLVAGINCAFF